VIKLPQILLLGLLVIAGALLVSPLVFPEAFAFVESTPCPYYVLCNPWPILITVGIVVLLIGIWITLPYKSSEAKK